MSPIVGVDELEKSISVIDIFRTLSGESQVNIRDMGILLVVEKESGQEKEGGKRGICV